MALKRTVIPDDWNPLEVAYNSSYNSYNSGPGADLDRNLQLPRRVTYTGSEQDFRLYVSNISPHVTEVGLKNMFSNFGEPRIVKIVNGKSGKGNIGFVSFSTLREAQVAISELHKTPPYFLNVSFANPSERTRITSERNELPNFMNEYELPEKSCRYSLPDTSEDRRRRIEAIIREKVYYNRKKNGVYEYGEEEPDESNVGPCSYCNRMTSLVCEQCSTTLYCSSRCQMKDFPNHKTICGSSVDLRISKEGEKRCVAVKVSDDTHYVNSKSHENFKSREKYNSSSHDKKYDRATDRADKLNESNRFREKSVTESSKETDRHVISGGMRVDIQVHNKSSGIRDNYPCKRENFDGNNAFHNRYNRSDKLFKNKHGSNKKESSNDKNIEVNSRTNEKIMDRNPLQKLQVDRHVKNYNSDIHNQSRCDKDSINFKELHKNNNQYKMDCTEVIKTLDNSKCENQKVCTKIENGSQDLSPARIGEQNLMAGTQVKSLLPFDVFTEVVISYVGECGEFWVQKQADLALIRSVTEGLAEEIVNAVTLESPKQKSKCAAKYADEWYRGRVVCTDPLKVQFVDWGNTEELRSANDIKILPEKFCTYPPMACKIHLADGTPDEYLRKKEFDTLKVKPHSKASDGSVIVQVEGVEEVSRGSPEQDICQPKSDSVQEMQTEEFSLTEEPDLSFMTKQSKQDASHDLEKPKKCFPTEDLELNTTTEVEICKIEEQCYWVTLQSRKEEFSELLFALQAVAEKSNPYLPSVNDLCMAVHENVWTRGYVKDAAELELFFFDLGETAKCSASSIRELPVQFHVYPPALVHKLRLVEETPNKYLNKKEGDCLSVKPISKCDDGSWLVEVEGADNDIPTQTCEQLDCSTDKNILPHDTYTEVVLVEKKSENVFYVQPQNMLETLFEMSNLLSSSAKKEDFKPCVGTLCANLYEGLWCRCHVMCVSDEGVSVFYIDFGNTEENVLLERLQPVPEKYVSIPPQAVLVKVVQEDINENLTLYNKYFVRPVSKLLDGTPVVHIRKDYIQVEENVSSMTATCQEKCVSDERVQLQPVHIQPNTTVKMSFMSDTSTIYVQRTDRKSVDMMEEILQEIGSHCQTAPLLDTQPLVADLVACRYSKDNNWYRAEILGRQEDKFHIFFVDYGNKAVVTVDNIRSLPDKYKNVPAQCVKIGLADCSPTELTPAAHQCLFEFFHQTLIIDFKNDDLSSAILKTEDGLVVNEKLKDRIIPSWKKALLANEDPTRNKLFFMEDLEYATLPQDKVVMVKAFMYCAPDVLVVCNVNTDLYKYVTTTLTHQISDYCNSVPEQTYNPRLRELCCVTKSEGCRQWRRAVCLESKVESSLLSLVDFGTQFYAPHKCIRRFVPDFISTPAMACFCNMLGIPEQPSKKLIEKVNSMIQENNIFEITVLNKEANIYYVHVPYIIDTLKAENLL